MDRWMLHSEKFIPHPCVKVAVEGDVEADNIEDYGDVDARCAQ